MLGPYGMTWLETPNLNRLAARALLIENFLVDSPQLDLCYRSYWCGRHAMDRRANGDQVHLIEQAWTAGHHTVLITDEPDLAALPLADAFAQLVVVPSQPVERAAENIADTELARVFAAAVNWLEQAPAQPFLMWIHARGMQGAWDAPADFRRQFADEEDPTPPDFVEPPQRLLPKGYDPDELLAVTHAYAGQVVLLDICVGVLLDALQTSRLAEQTALLLTSPRGYPLGEHRIIGHTPQALYGELLHVPLMLAAPAKSRLVGIRDQAVAQPGHLYATIAQLCGLELPKGDVWPVSLLPLIDGQPTALPVDRACAITEQEQAIRTPAWFLRQNGQGESALFVKPDDRWEVNEVAARCADVVQLLQEALEQFQLAAEVGALHRLPALPEPLSNPRF